MKPNDKRNYNVIEYGHILKLYSFLCYIFAKSKITNLDLTHSLVTLKEKGQGIQNKILFNFPGQKMLTPSIRDFIGSSDKVKLCKLLMNNDKRIL